MRARWRARAWEQARRWRGQGRWHRRQCSARAREGKEERKGVGPLDISGSAPEWLAPSSAPRSTASSSALEWLAPSSLPCHLPCPGARRQRRWRLARRHWCWRRAKGPFPEYFPPGVYSWETLQKGPNYKKIGSIFYIFDIRKQREWYIQRN